MTMHNQSWSAQKGTTGGACSTIGCSNCSSYCARLHSGSRVSTSDAPFRSPDDELPEIASMQNWFAMAGSIGLGLQLRM